MNEFQGVSRCVVSSGVQHFNSRSCQLVLGAGALQVVGLKTITTKNLGRNQPALA